MLKRIALLICGCCLVLTGSYHTLGPVRYRATARVSVVDTLSPGTFDGSLVQSEMAVILSEAVSRKVRAKLCDLEEEWPRGRTLLGGLPDLELRPVVNTHIIDIKAASEDPEKAAIIANTVASMYGEVAVGSGKRQVLVLGKAEAPQLPSFPKPHVAGVSMLLGGFLLGLGTSRSGAKPRNQSSPAKAKPSDPVPY